MKVACLAVLVLCGALAADAAGDDPTVSMPGVVDLSEWVRFCGGHRSGNGALQQAST